MRFPGWILRTATVMAFFCGLLNAGEPATALASVTAGFVTAITVTSGGSGYTSEPAVTITGGGGSGATAKAILNGDKVAVVVVLTAGSGYSRPPAVSIETPPRKLNLALEMIPKLTVAGPPGSLAQVEWAGNVAGPWAVWSNVLVSAEGVVLVDLRPRAEGRFYRAVSDPRPAGFVWIPPGTFLMGSPTNEPGRAPVLGGPSEVQHTVTLTRGFWMCDHEVTQSEYQSVLGKVPSNFKGAPDRPVETVSWGDAMAYCQELTARERAAGRITMQQTYRLPTEAEWEYAARAGTSAARYAELDSIAWFLENSGNQTHPVRQKLPNSWGLYDMYGNVSELCLDYVPIGFSYPASMVDPLGCCGDQYDPMIVRGGSWQSSGNEAHFIELRAAARGSLMQDNLGRAQIGFRPVLSAVR
jgi:formylglycine-generating enzyme required for sulfatase activity